MKLSTARARILPTYFNPISLKRHMQILNSLSRVEKRVWWQWFPSLNAEHILIIKEAHGRLGVLQGGREGLPANKSGYLDDVLPKPKIVHAGISTGPNSPQGGDAA